MLKNWRFWLLGGLLVVPPAVFITFGWLWLAEHGWGLIGFFAWMLFGLLFGIFSSQWTRSARPVLTPIDWSAPRTFAPRDRDAWLLVQTEAESADRVTMEELGSPQLYMNTGLRIADVLARHYHPKSTEPLDHVPLAQLLTALELAADDMGRMIREVPGGDMITVAHFKTAIQAAGFVSKANEYYNYLLPLVQPVQGLLRLSTHKLMTQPAWRNMQQNLMQWFYRAYVQKLGMHLIELYSGRLVIGVETYRHLTGRGSAPLGGVGEGRLAPKFVVAIAGARGSGKTTLAQSLRELWLLPEVENSALLGRATLRELEGYSLNVERESLRDRWSRDSAQGGAHDCDLLILVIDARRDDLRADARFVQDWHDWFEGQGGLELPPCLVVLTNVDRLMERGDDAGDASGPFAVASAIRARVDATRRVLPGNWLTSVIAVDLSTDPRAKVATQVMPEIHRVLERAQRASLIRHLHAEAARSKVGRFFNQVGRQGRRAWDNVADNVGRRIPRFGWGGAREPHDKPK